MCAGWRRNESWNGCELWCTLRFFCLNNLFKIKSYGDELCFVDDTTIIYGSESWNTLKGKVEKNIPKIIRWYLFLTVNLDKTRFLSFGCYSNCLSDYTVLNLQINDTVMALKSMRQTKYLDVIFIKK